MMKRSPPRLGPSGVALFLVFLLGGCVAQTTPPTPGAEDFNDPYENTNREIFKFNQSVDRNVLAPVARAYKNALPDQVRESLHDFYNNLNEPLIFANDVLQAQPHQAGDTFARFLINSTIGLGGLVDVAGKGGIPYHDNDMGITFAVWGIAEGPYLMIPILGPSNPRDLSGEVVESFGDPWDNLAANNGYIWIPFVRAAASGIDERSRYLDSLADLERTSLDYYAAIRSLYRQRRAALIQHKQENLPANPSLSRNDPAMTPTATANPPGASGVSSE